MSTIERALSRQKAQQQASAENKPQGEEIKDSVPAVEASADKQQPVAASAPRDSNLYLDLDLTDATRFVTSENSRSNLSEEFRAIKRKVLDTAFGPLSKTLKNANIVMVSSANPGEGKTFSAVNLALSIALEQNKTVLLVDADVLKPNVMRTLGAEYENGLMEYLLEEVSDLSEVIYHTNIDKLRIIPAGKKHHLSTELLASEKMLQTVTEFANRYSDRVVIIDCPPLLGINETLIMTNLAGQAVIVVEEGKTKLTEIQAAVQNLNPDMAKGFIVNKSQRSAGSGYGYGYGYGYGHYYASGQ
ncbi:XrtA-associated tyrosine autokinase [Bowmanella sp. JS7-9]|uniref:non-specific protein-tyrosine kinase n=1 Tax=Pseudobowmanella zhangzhouensis TaxID=1537679 RepID=A0ABW1XFD9_9ALTE|nr:XrtA-associated tyrosine autokinase [Bowmanella sp. JS7-9]TBX20831.1 exopolysaccharide biosynthesis protein [Bowmanella sp. JS7-9]